MPPARRLALSSVSFDTFSSAWQPRLPNERLLMGLSIQLLGERIDKQPRVVVQAPASLVQSTERTKSGLTQREPSVQAELTLAMAVRLTATAGTVPCRFVSSPACDDGSTGVNCELNKDLRSKTCLQRFYPMMHRIKTSNSRVTPSGPSTSPTPLPQRSTIPAAR